MRTVKKSAILILMLFMFVFGTCSVSASEESRVFDYDNSLSDEEEKMLDESIREAEQKYGKVTFDKLDNNANVIEKDVNFNAKR